MRNKLLYKVKSKYYEYRYRHMYDNEYTYGEIEFIWGVGCANPNLHTMNDIDIVYDKKSQKYLLGIETALLFNNTDEWCDYLSYCLDSFTEFMVSSGYNTNAQYMPFLSDLTISYSADSIEELYCNFKIFVNGYLSVNNCVKPNSTT